VSELVTIYRCADGADFPVAWEDEAAAEITWSHNDQHWPAPLRPLDIAAWQLSLPARERAFSEAGLQLPGPFRRVSMPNGFVYMGPPSNAQDGIDDLVRRYGGVAQVWEEYCRPRVAEACAELQAAGDEVSVTGLIDTCFHAFMMTQVAAAAMFSGSGPLASFVVEEFGLEAEAFMGELTQGYANPTMEASQSLWEIAQAASSSPEVRELMLGSDLSTALDTLPHVDGGAQFRSAFECFLQRYGWRSQGWEVASPTWREQPTIPLGIIRRMIIDETPSPAGALDGVAHRRRELADELENRLRSDPAKRDEFRDLLALASSYVSVREDRAHWQLTAFGSLRAVVLGRGEKMAQAGLIDTPDDILYLLPEEIEGQNEAIRSTLRSVVEERRKEWERWSRVQPPHEIGVIDEATTAETASGDEREIHGVAASQGVATGPAKVVSDIADGDKLRLGDVLVCRTTSPPWTVLFGRAAAVVTDTGGALAHTAITAREYAIPCVVGARGATDRIHDGMLVTVNGTEGVVLLTI